MCYAYKKSSIRVELRPKKGETNNHQLWCYNQGYFVNKHSGCGKALDSKKKRNRLINKKKNSVGC